MTRKQKIIQSLLTILQIFKGPLRFYSGVRTPRGLERKTFDTVLVASKKSLNHYRGFRLQALTCRSQDSRDDGEQLTDFTASEFVMMLLLLFGDEQFLHAKTTEATVRYYHSSDGRH